MNDYVSKLFEDYRRVNNSRPTPNWNCTTTRTLGEP